MRSIVRKGLAAVLALSGCATGSQQDLSARLSATALRDLARKDEESARRELAAASAPALQPNLAMNPVGIPEGYIYSAGSAVGYDPREDHLRRARRLAAHAQRYERAAEALERSQRAKADGPPGSRTTGSQLGREGS